MYESIVYEVTNGVAIVSLNRPQVYNAINQTMGEELYDALKRIELDWSIRAAVLTGVGKGFCAGQDLGDRTTVDDSVRLGDSVRERYNTLLLRMKSLQVPLIAAVNGVAAGAGFGLALACDIRIAADSAKFTMAFNKIGLVPDSATSYFLPRIVGYAKALELTWSSEVFSANQALQWGVVQRVVPSDALMSETIQYAAQLAEGPTLAFRMTRELLDANLVCSLPEALEREAQMQDRAGRTTDFREGVLAFTEKRAPQFRGK